MIKTSIASAALALFAALPAHAVVAVQWDFENPPADLSNAMASPLVGASTGVGTASGWHASAATDWTTPAGNGSPNAFSSNTWAIGDYWQFSFSTLGHADLMLSFETVSSGTGPRDFTVYYSIDGTNFTNVGVYFARENASPPWSAGSATALDARSADLSGFSVLDNQPSVTLRLVNTTNTSANMGAIGTGGTNRIDNVTVMLTPVPEPGTWALMFAGLAAVGAIARRRA